MTYQVEFGGAALVQLNGLPSAAFDALVQRVVALVEEPWDADLMAPGMIQQSARPPSVKAAACSPCLGAGQTAHCRVRRPPVTRITRASWPNTRCWLAAWPARPYQPNAAWREPQVLTLNGLGERIRDQGRARHRA
jgi:hypothetical protein